MLIRSANLREGETLAAFAESVRDGLRGEWWATATLFEITAFETESDDDGTDTVRISYRVRESPQYCIVDVVEKIVLADSLPGLRQAFRARNQMCAWETSKLASARAEILDSFRIAEVPAAYYTQFVNVAGVEVRASAKVKPQALIEAAKVVAVMLNGRLDLADCVAGWNSGLAIFPEGYPMTDLPEFAFLRGRKDIWGRRFDESNSTIWGGGAIKERPVSSTYEQNLLADTDHYFPQYHVTVHEFAHHIMNLCFTQDDHALWEDLRRESGQAGSIFGEGLMVNVDEFFAGLSSAYFGINGGIPKRALRRFPNAVLASLEDIYGALTPADTDVRSRIRYVTQSGIPLPWVVDD